MKFIHKKLLLLFCIFTTFTITIQKGYGQGQLISQFNKTVSFLYVSVNGQFEPYGTGFLVSIPAKTTQGSYIYLVTAKHVLFDANKRPLTNVYAKFNTKDSSQMFRVDLVWGGMGKTVFVHTDPTIDIAIIPVTLPGNLDYKHIDVSQIIKRNEYEKEGINVGTQVFFTGLFTPYISSKTINPIFRFGRICLIPYEKIEFDKINRDLILIESSTFGGNSGSPVIFNYTNPQGNLTFARLAGIVLGTYNQGQAIGNQLAWSSIGISAITPAEFILEILDGPELANIRR